MHPQQSPKDRRRRSPARVIGALAGVVGLAVVVPGQAVAAGNGNALDEAEHHEPGTYELDVLDRTEALESIGNQPEVEPVTFEELVESRWGETTSCGDTCRVWPDHLNDHDTWYPQGLAGSEESNWADAPETEVLVSAWYQRTSPDDHASVDSALKFVSTEDWQYRNVPLRIPVRTDDGGWTTEPLESHNGGVAWAGPYLYVAATSQFHRFDLRTIMADDDGYFMVPDRSYRGVDSEPYGAARLSSASTDWTGEPAIVSAQYTAEDEAAEVIRWPLNESGDLAEEDGTVGSQYNFWIDKDSSIDKVQGVAAVDGLYLFTGSAGTLDLARVDTQEDRDTFDWGRTGDETHIPEDLYLSGANVYGQTEVPGHRELFWAAREDILP